MAVSFTLADYGETPVDIKAVAPVGTTITVTNIQRPLKAPMTRHRVEIPGKAGSWDFDVDVARDYTITVELLLVAITPAKLMECARAVEAQLDGEKVLVFDDETDVSYTVKVYEQTNMETEGVPFAARVAIIFECKA